MPWSEDYVYSGILILVAVIVASYFVRLFFNPQVRDVVYGRHDTEESGLRVNTRLAWILMEAPAALVFLAAYLLGGGGTGSGAQWAIFGLWMLHYVHRSFIYPFQIAVRPGSTSTLSMMAGGMLFCGINGYLNGMGIASYAEHLTTNEWLSDPRFMMGTTIFFIGYYINRHADYTLLNLRKNGNPGEYQIPFGGMYRYVSNANYFGEIVIWTGFAIAAWTPAALIFVFMTLMNLGARAVDNHNWYKNKFEDYPGDRKILIPYIY